MSPRRCFQPEFQNGRWTPPPGQRARIIHMLFDRQVQLRLPMGSNKPKRTDSAPASASADSQNGRPGIDQLLSTRDVMRITGKQRCTVYRWIRTGTFPPKRAGGGRGWLRSDVERWLANGT